MNVKALKWKETFALPLLFSLPPDGDVVVTVFTLGLLFSDSSSSLVNEASASHDSSLVGLVLTVEQ